MILSVMETYSSFPPIIKKSLLFLAVTAGYFLIGTAGLQLATLNPNSSPIWFSSGFAVGAILLFGTRVAPAIFIGTFLTNMMVKTPLLALLSISYGNTMEAYLGALLVAWVLRKNLLKNYSEFFAITTCAFLPTIISATIGVTSLYFLDAIGDSKLIYSWFTWWSGDAIGVLVVLPLFVEIYLRKDRKKTPVSSLFLGFLFIIGLLAVTNLVFLHDYNQAFSWTLCPLFILCGITLGLRASRIILIVVSVFIVVLTASGHSPFEYGNLNLNLIYIQCLLASYSFATLFGRPFGLSFKGVRKFMLGNAIGWACLFLVIFALSTIEKKYLIDDINKSINSSLESLKSASFQRELILDSGKAFYSLNPQLTYLNWKEFVATINIESRFDDINGLGIILPVKRTELNSFKERLKKKIHRPFEMIILNQEYSDNFPDHHIVSFIEPLGPNSGAFGLDTGSEKNRREAAESARQFDRPFATKTVKLVQDKRKRPGFLIYQPMWDKNKSFLGWTFIPVISENFFNKIFLPFTHILNMKVYEDEHAVYSSLGSQQLPSINPNFLVKKEINIFGINHIIEYYPSDLFLRRHTGFSPALALLLTLFMFFIAGFLIEQMSLGERAEVLIEKKTKELEDSKMQLVHTSKMASLGEMASGMAHEINNPLTVILGKVTVINMMLDELQIKDRPLKEEINKIKITVDRIGKIVKGLRSFSRASQNDPFESVSLERIIQETLDLCSERLRVQGIVIKIDPIPDIAIICKPGQISQVLLNLLSNSSDAIEGYDEKWIALSFELKDPKTLYLSITDNGPGIPPSIADKMMEPFYTTKDAKRGTGLGLSIAKGIIEDHEGKIWLDIHAPHTRFVIELPVDEA